MTGDGNRVAPKRYGLLKGQIQITDDFDAPLEAELGMSDTPEIDAGNPDESSDLYSEDRNATNKTLQRTFNCSL